MVHDGTQEELATMAATYRTHAGHLTRAVEAANLVVTEATLRAPNHVIMAQLERCLARVRDQEHNKCAQICEDIRDAQESTDANEAHIEASCTRDANCAKAAGVAITQQMARYEIGLQPPAVAESPVGHGPAQRIICKQEKDLKPQELTEDMTPVEFAFWVDAFEAYHAGSHMEVAPMAVQQAFFKACVKSVLFNRIKSNIVSGVTPVLGPGNTVMELMRDEFLLEHSLFSRRLEFFRFTQGKGPCQMQ
jgi:hypothetical protein